MLDNQLIQVFLPVINAQLTAYGYSGVTVIAANQPTQQGIPTGPTVYFYKLNDHRLGFLRRFDTWGGFTLIGTTNGTTLVTMPSTSGLSPGMSVVAANISQGTTIVSIVPNVSITLSAAATGSSIGETITFNSVMVHTEEQQYETTFQVNALVIQSPSTPNQYTASDLVNDVCFIMQSDSTREILYNNQISILRVTDVTNGYFVDDKDNFEANPSFDFTLSYVRSKVSTGKVVSQAELDINRV
jgi:hypothetical protein